jgi:hypothetical protein
MGQLALHCACGVLGRRFFMRGAPCAAYVAPSLRLAGPPVSVRAANWRGVVGCVKPRVNDRALVDM